MLHTIVIYVIKTTVYLWFFSFYNGFDIVYGTIEMREVEVFYGNLYAK